MAMNDAVVGPCTTISAGCDGGTLSGDLDGNSSESCTVGFMGTIAVISFAIGMQETHYTMD